MKTGIAALAIALALPSIAHATNFCASFGSAQVVGSGLTLPASGTCSAFNGFYRNKPGLLLAGDVCASSDGSTFLFNLFTQFNGADSLAGTWAASNGRGSGKECSKAPCMSFTVTVTACPNNPIIPKDQTSFGAEATAALTAEP